jgi:hypothetical protein
MRHKEFWEFLQNIHPDLIICESFEYRSRARDNLELYSRELIGIANLYNQLNYDTKLIMQSAAQAKAPFDNEKLTSLGVYKKGKEHGRDAMRHFLYWLNFGHGYQFNVNQELHLV